MNLILDPQVERNSPFVFHILTSSDCNLGCKYCFADKTLAGFDVDNIINNFDKLLSKWNGDLDLENSKVCLSFTGEPMVHKKKFLKLYQHLLDLGFKTWNIEWFTNGTLFNMDEDFSWLCKHSVIISYDGKNSDRVTKDGRQVDEIVRNNIKYLSERGVVVLEKAVVPIKNNYGDLYEKGLEILEAGGISLVYSVERKCDYDKKDYDKLLKQFKNFYKRLASEVKKGNNEVLTKFNLEADVYQYNASTTHSNCAVYNPKLITLDSKGNISKCEYEQSNIYCTVDDFDLDKYLLEFNPKIDENNKVPQKCEKCKILSLCGDEHSFCRYKSYYFECELQKIKWKYIGKIANTLNANMTPAEVEFLQADLYAKINNIKNDIGDRLCHLDKRLYNYVFRNDLYWEMPLDAPAHIGLLTDENKKLLVNLARTKELLHESIYTSRIENVAPHISTDEILAHK